MKYNVWNKWDPLEVCMLGNNYTPEFFNGIPDKAGDPLKKICEETLEDLEVFKNTLQDFGVEVIQPIMNNNERFIDNPSRYPRGPLQPRDHFCVLGNELYYSGEDHSAIENELQNYESISQFGKWNFDYPSPLPKDKYDEIAGSDFPAYEYFMNHRRNNKYFSETVYKELIDYSAFYTGLSGACCFQLGKRLDMARVTSTGKQIENFDYNKGEIEQFIPSLKNFDINYIYTEGLTDGNYHPIKPGAILSLHDVQTYKDTFPGWDVCYLAEESWHKVSEFRKVKHKNHGKWYLAGEEENDEFTNFVETWLTDWVGYVEETVFDVNVLMLDEHHCCVSNNKNDIVKTFFKKHKIEPVYIPWRHRYFWDGGLHCITLELKRKGKQKDYFNEV